MAEHYKEQVVKSAMSEKDRAIKLLIGIVIIFSIFAFLPIMDILKVIIIAVIFFVDYKYTKIFATAFLDRTIEQEYIAMGDSFSIDTVINRSSRRQGIDINLSDVICFSKLDDNKLMGLSHDCKVLDYSNIKNKNTNDKFAFIINIDDKKTKVIFEPNEDVVEIIKTFVPKHAQSK